MAEKVGSIYIDMTVNNDKANKELKETSKHLDDTGRSADNTSKMTNTLKLGMAAAGVAALKFGKDSVNAYFDSEKAHTKLVTNLKVLKTNTDANVVSLEKMAAKLQKVGVVEDDVIIAGMSQLATFKLQSETIEKLTPKINDMVAQLKGHNATAEDTVAINNLIGKAMTGSTGALSKYGIIMDENQKKIIQTGSESEKAAILVDVLSQNYGKVNEALGKTPQGKITQLKNAFGDLQESVGKALVDMALPVMDALSGKSGDVMEILKGVITTVGQVGGSFIKALVPVLDVLKPLISLLKGFTTLVGAVPPIFLQVALGAALLSKGLDKITLNSKSSLAGLRDINTETRKIVPVHASAGKALFQTGSNFQNIGLHAQNMWASVKTSASNFGDSVGAMASKAKKAGANIVDALGGPMGIGIMAGFAAFDYVTGKMDEADKKAKALKTEVKDVAKELRFNTIASTGLQQVSIIFDKLKEQGGEIAKAIKTIGDGFKSISLKGQDNVKGSIAGQLKNGLSDEEIQKLVANKDIYDATMADLKPKADLARGSNAANRTIGNVFGDFDSEKAAEKAQTNLKRIREGVINSQKEIFISNQNLAKSLHRDDLATIFGDQAKRIKDGNFDQAIVLTTAATHSLNIEQAKLTDNAYRASLGLEKLTDSTTKDATAMKKGGEAAAETLAELGKISSAVTKITSNDAFSIQSKATMSKIAANYIDAAKIGADAADKYALQVTESLGLTADKSTEVATKLAELGSEQVHGYSTFLTTVASGLVPLDEAFAEKMEIKPGGASASMYLENLKTLDAMNSQFIKDVDWLYTNGFKDLAASISMKGAQAAGNTASSMVAAAKAGNTSIAQAADELVKNSNGVLSSKIIDATQKEMDIISNRTYVGNPIIEINPSFKSQDFIAKFQSNIQFRAAGGPVSSGMPYIVGENGPELFTPGSSGNIIDANKTSSMLSRSMTGSLTDNKTGNTYINVDMSKVMAVSRTQVREVGNTFIEAVNEGLIARGIAPIADNKVRSAQ